MFDNSIFATFIPQMLMLLGYASCLVAPYLTVLISSDAIPQENIVAQSIEADYEYSISIDTGNDYYFFDFYQSEELDNQSSDNILIPFFISDLAISNCLVKPHSAFPLTVFSRPPPCFC